MNKDMTRLLKKIAFVLTLGIAVSFGLWLIKVFFTLFNLIIYTIFIFIIIGIVVILIEHLTKKIDGYD